MSRAEYLLDLCTNRTPPQGSSGRNCDASDRGEGEIYVTTVTVRTDEVGLVRFSFTAEGVQAGDEFMTCDRSPRCASR